MIKIKALNDSLNSSASSDSDHQITREVEEEELNKLYTDALKHASSGETEKAIELLEKLKNELDDENPKIKEATLLAKLRYLTLKNLGIIKNDINHLLDALNIDDSDITMWLRVGKKSKQQLDYLLAKYCFEAAFNIHDSNLIAIDNLCEIYFVLDDLYSCASVCLHALEIIPDLIKPKVILQECLRLMPPLAKEISDHPLESLLQLEIDDFTLDESVFEQILEPLAEIKRKRHRRGEGAEKEKDDKKRRKLTIELYKKEKLTFAEIGLKIKKTYEQIQTHHYLFTPIEVLFQEQQSISIGPPEPAPTIPEVKEVATPDEEAGIIEGSNNSQSNPAATQADNSKDVAKEDENSKPKFNRYDYAMDYDKRRSARVKGGGRASKNKEYDDEQAVFEFLIDTLPDDLKSKDLLKKAFGDKDSGNSNSSSIPAEDVKQDSTKTCNEVSHLIEFLNKLEAKAKTKGTFTILELIEFYLVEMSQLTRVSLPKVFDSLYQYYREQFALPCGLLCDIGNEITLDMIYVVLVASENNFNKNEIIFIAQILGKISQVLSDELFRQFLIRYLVITGSKDCNSDNLYFALDLCSDDPQHANVFGLTITRPENEDAKDEYQVMASNKLIVNTAYIQTLLDIQRFSIKSAKDRECTEVVQLFFTKSENEMTSEEKEQLCEAIVKAEMWQKGVELFEKWNDFDAKCLRTILECVRTGERARCSSRLAYKMVKKASLGWSVVPWLILYWIHITEGASIEDAQTKLIQFFKVGHHVLGKKAMCTQHEGEFLVLAYKVFTLHDVEQEAFNCSTCLFNFPARKNQSPSLVHASPHIQMKWSHCQDVYYYFAPEKMPEFDSVGKQFQIVPEMRDFLIRISKLVPESERPSTRSVRRYINQGNHLPVALVSMQEDREETKKEEDDRLINTIYYLLADCYFKAKDFDQAECFYLLDLSVNANRFDAWAGLSLSYSYKLSTLIDKEGPYTRHYHEAAFRVVQCFEAALALQPENCKLWIEYGFLAYSIASNLSRAEDRKAKFGDNFKADKSMFEREKMLDKAQQCFENANNLENDEPWLAFYMLGKVAEKRKETVDIFDILKHYEYADVCMYMDGVTYPKKIPYYNLTHLAIEAMEVYYRMHVVILKYLVNNRKFTARLLRMLYYKLVSYRRLPFAVRRAPLTPGTKKAGTKNQEANLGPARDEQDMLELMDDLVANISERYERAFNLIEYRDKLIKLCLVGLRRCISRYGGHYKSYYRLAHYYYAKKDDNNTAKAILLGSLTANKGNVELQLEDAEVGKKIVPAFMQGLFAEQRPNNVHQGIWRIQIEEIERSGTFNAHMFKATLLLIQVCESSDDYNQLCQIATSLSKTPEMEKKYLNEQERVILSRVAYDKCFAVLTKLWARYPKVQMLAVVDAVIQNFHKNNLFPEKTIEHLSRFKEDYLKEQLAMVVEQQKQRHLQF